MPREDLLPTELHNGITFHNGEPVTAEDVKFSFDRYRGSGAGLLKERVREVEIVDPARVRFLLKEPAYFTATRHA